MSEVHQMKRDFADRVEWTAGWMHDFVCARCATQLCFDVDAGAYARDSFKCPRCGSAFSGSKYREAWVNLYRRWYAERLGYVALCADDPEALEYLRGYVDFYAAHYADFSPHGEHIGQGRIMGQSLNEAMFGVSLLRAIHACRERLDVGTLARWYECLFAPMAKLLMPQGESVKNISVWIQCCVGMIGLVFGREALVERALHGEYGLERQLREGLTSDDLWREGSLHYHYYALEPLTHLCALLALRAPGHPLLNALRRMYLAPLRLSPDGWQLPALNDGWYPTTLGAYGVQIVRAACITGDAALLEQARRVVWRMPELLEDPDVMSCLRDRAPDVQLCFDGRVAVLRTPLWMTLKSGSIVPVHAHRDRLSITIEPFSRDPGTPGYGSPLIKTWYRGGYAHSGVIVDGVPIDPVGDDVCRVVDGGVEATAPGIARRLTPLGDGVADLTRIDMAGEHTFEWLLHLEGRLECAAQLRPAAYPGSAEVYRLFENVREVVARERFALTVEAADGRMLEVGMRLSEGMRAFVADTPGNPADVRRHTILLRAQGSGAAFEASYRCLPQREAREALQAERSIWRRMLKRGRRPHD